MSETAAIPGARYLLEPLSPAVSLERDVVIYGATSGGVAAARRLADAGRRVLLLAFDDHVGGMTTGGLGYTDVGDARTIGGLAAEFYASVARAHGSPAPDWFFEPSLAQAILDEWLARPGVELRRRQQLAGVEARDGRIRAITMRDGSRYAAPLFVDASYEGDLLAAAGVSYHVGREASSVYDEPIAGAQHDRGHQFVAPVDPYRVPGDPASGLLPGIDPAPFGEVGAGDDRVPAYTFRLCVSTAADRIPVPRPAGYDPGRYELLLRYLRTGEFDLLGRTCRVHGELWDMNNHGAVSSDLIGGSREWPEADYERRAEIFDEHVRYQAGMLYFLRTDPRVPAEARAAASSIGLAPQEFAATGHWPPQLYVREARRMIGERVVTQRDALDADAVSDPVALASYTMDSHHVRRYVADGAVRNEGNVQHELSRPFGISYRSILPRRDEARNLLVIAAISSSHVAFSSVRMEPVFLMLGDAAATAGHASLELGVDPHDVPYELLRARLRATGAVLEVPEHAPAARENVA